jgi:hypothetical protein
MVKDVGKETANVLATPIHGGMAQAHEALDHLDAVLIEQVAKDVTNFKVDHDLLEASNPNSKWRLASCMQKAIRRGDVPMAVDAAHALGCVDTTYLYRRLAVTAIEDTGVANVWAMAKVLAMMPKTHRQKTGHSDKMIGACLAQQLAEGLKDRTCIDLYCSVDMGTGYDEFRAAREDYQLDQLLTEVGGNGLQLDRVAAAMMCLTPNHRYHSSFDKGKTGSTGMLLDLYAKAGMPLVVLYAAVKLGSRVGEAMLVALPFACEALFDEVCEIEVVEEPLPPAVMVGKLISPTYDMHTLEGKKARSAFLTRSKTLQQFMTSYKIEKPKDLLDTAIFYVEGGRLDRRIYTPWIEKVRACSHKADFESFGLPVEHKDEIGNIVLQKLPRLNSSRKWAVLGGSPK